MIERLLELKDFCHEIDLYKEFDLNDTYWNNLQDLCCMLKPIHELNVKLQKSDLLAGDFYSLWIVTKMDINKIASKYSTLMLSAIEGREKMILNNEALLCCIFLGIF